MNIDLNRKYATVVLLAVLLIAVFTCDAARKPSPVPDLTKGSCRGNFGGW